MQVSGDALRQAAATPAAPAKPLDPEALDALVTPSLDALTADERQALAPTLKAPDAPRTEAQAECNFQMAVMRVAMSAQPGLLRSLTARR